MKGTIDTDIFQVKRSSRFTLLGKTTHHITEYSNRSLTYEKDTLDAFRGILLKGPFDSFYGIIIMPNDHHISIGSDTGFAIGLWWTPALVEWPKKYTSL
jgi:hypothetical protein